MDKSYGEFIKYHRLKSGFTSQRQLADKSGVSRTTISRVEKEEQKPEPNTLKKLAVYLKTTSYGELMINAGYWDPLDKDTQLLTEIHEKERDTLELILKYLKTIVDDEGYFPHQYHKEIFEIFSGYSDSSGLPVDLGNQARSFDGWYETDYLYNLHFNHDDYSDSYIAEGISEFNIYYNYSTIKHGMQNLEDNFTFLSTSLGEFLDKLKVFCNKHGFSIKENPPPVVSSKKPETVKIPILGDITCADPIFTEENFSGHRIALPGDLPTGDLVYLQAKGDSMNPTVPDGTWVLIRVQKEVRNGQLAAVTLNGYSVAVLRRVKKQGDMLILLPDNNEFEPVFVTEDNPVLIIGVAVRTEQIFNYNW